MSLRSVTPAPGSRRLRRSRGQFWPLLLAGPLLRTRPLLPLVLALSAPILFAGCAAVLGADFTRDLRESPDGEAPRADSSHSPSAAGSLADATAHPESSPSGDEAGPVEAGPPGAIDAPSKDSGPPPTPASCGDVHGLDPASPWPTLGGCNTRVGRSRAASPRNPRIAWRYRLGLLGSLSNGFLGAPVVAGDGSLYLFAYRAVDANPLERVLVGVRSSGDEAFMVPLPVGEGYLSGGASPTIGADGTIYTAALGTLTAWTTTGTVKWSRSLGAAEASSPAILGDGTIVVIASQAIAAFRPDGTSRWSYPADGFSFIGSVAVTQTGLLAASEMPVPGTLSGAVHIVSDNGVRQLKLALPMAPETMPLIDETGRLIVRSTVDFHVFSSTGAVELLKAGGGPSSPSVQASYAPPLVWFTGTRGTPRTLDLGSALTAQVLSHWSQSTVAASYADGTVAVGVSGSGSNRLLGIDRAGSTAWSVDLETTGADPLGPAIGMDGTVYLPWGNVLYAIRD